jgi:hypothetical protein
MLGLFRVFQIEYCLKDPGVIKASVTYTIIYIECEISLKESHKIYSFISQNENTL